MKRIIAILSAAAVLLSCGSASALEFYLEDEGSIFADMAENDSAEDTASEQNVEYFDEMETTEGTVWNDTFDFYYYIESLMRPTDYKIDISSQEAGKIYDNNYAAYRPVVEQCISQYGEPHYTEESMGPHFEGLSFLKLVDFNEDGNEELLLVFCVYEDYPGHEEKVPEYMFNIWGYDGEKAILLSDGEELYAGDGGRKTVLIVKNEYGTYFVKGGADDFSCDCYYGYNGERFGLVKWMMYGVDDSLEPDYWIDGIRVSTERYKQEENGWNYAYQQEYYSITPHSVEEKNRTMNQIKETLAALHCDER